MIRYTYHCCNVYFEEMIIISVTMLKSTTGLFMGKKTLENIHSLRMMHMKKEKLTRNSCTRNNLK
jgi:hypothetical protein